MSKPNIKPIDSLHEKLNGQRLILVEAYDKINIHLQLLNLDLKRNEMNENFNTKQVRIKHIEKVEANILSHIYFMEDLMKKIGGNYNVGY